MPDIKSFQNAAPLGSETAVRQDAQESAPDNTTGNQLFNSGFNPGIDSSIANRIWLTAPGYATIAGFFDSPFVMSASARTGPAEVETPPPDSPQTLPPGQASPSTHPSTPSQPPPPNDTFPQSGLLSDPPPNSEDEVVFSNGTGYHAPTNQGSAETITPSPGGGAIKGGAAAEPAIANQLAIQTGGAPGYNASASPSPNGESESLSDQSAFAFWTPPPFGDWAANWQPPEDSPPAFEPAPGPPADTDPLSIQLGGSAFSSGQEGLVDGLIKASLIDFGAYSIGYGTSSFSAIGVSVNSNTAPTAAADSYVNIDGADFVFRSTTFNELSLDGTQTALQAVSSTTSFLAIDVDNFTPEGGTQEVLLPTSSPALPGFDDLSSGNLGFLLHQATLLTSDDQWTQSAQITADGFALAPSSHVSHQIQSVTRQDENAGIGGDMLLIA